MQIKETYVSINEIKELASIILQMAAKRAFPYMEAEKKFGYLNGVFINGYDIFEPNREKFKELSKFLESTNITVYFVYNETATQTYADYSVITNEKTYNPKWSREINLYFSKDFIGDINDAINPPADSWVTKFNETSLYMKLFFKFNSALIHELQHAYDDYRSKNKIFQSKQSKDFMTKYPETQTKEIGQDLERAKSYLNLPYEIWARFTQTMLKVEFYSVDFNKTSDGFDFFMIPIEKVVNKFKINFPGYHILSDDDKKRLLNKVVQFWHFEQDKVKLKNSEEAKRLSGKQAQLAEVRKIVRSVLFETNNNITVDFTKERPGNIYLGNENIGTLSNFIRGKYLILDKIEIWPDFRGKGYAEEAMRLLLSYADKNKLIITLTPDDAFGSNKNRLILWYKSLGFIINQGKNKDFETMQLMYRLPR